MKPSIFFVGCRNSTVFKEHTMVGRFSSTQPLGSQVLAGNYDQLSDLWSCGVIMYVGKAQSLQLGDVAVVLVD